MFHEEITAQCGPCSVVSHLTRALHYFPVDFILELDLCHVQVRVCKTCFINATIQMLRIIGSLQQSLERHTVHHNRTSMLMLTFSGIIRSMLTCQYSLH